ncbi:MAG TPA: hypothetical protein VHE37_14305 [Nevskiaceae bacterium]|nr:hypothetical protein [Nevskiaceae bacterium]
MDWKPPEWNALSSRELAAVPPVKVAVGLIGGAPKLAKLRSKTVSLATAAVPAKLQLAVWIAQRHYPVQRKTDLEQSVRASLARPYAVENMVYLLNQQDGPWATAISGHDISWKPVKHEEVACLLTRGEFLELVFHHLR